MVALRSYDIWHLLKGLDGPLQRFPDQHNPEGTVQILPDVITHGLRVLFCGSAAGTKSALLGAYFAGPGNRFWPTLHEIGLTPRILQPIEFKCSLVYGLGLTDLAKNTFGPDSSLSAKAYDSTRLRGTVEGFAPSVLAFNGKAPARAFLEHPVKYGLQPEQINDTSIFVLPSTSGAARRYWDSQQWHDLSRFVTR